MIRRARSRRHHQLLVLVVLVGAAALAGVPVANWLVAAAAPRPSVAAPNPVPSQIPPATEPTGAPLSVLPTESPTVTTAEQPRVSRPARLKVPAIDVDAPIIELGLNADSSLEVPENFSETGWWTGGPRPGELGPAVIAGHVDSKSGPAVFYLLHKLKKGDTIRVEGRDGTTRSFTVDRIEQHPKDDFPTDAVYRSDLDQHALRLITCGGSFDRSSGRTIATT